MYAQHNRGIGRGRKGRDYYYSRDHGSENNNEEKGKTNQQNWRDKTTVMEEVIILII